MLFSLSVFCIGAIFRTRPLVAPLPWLRIPRRGSWALPGLISMSHATGNSTRKNSRNPMLKCKAPVQCIFHGLAAGKTSCMIACRLANKRLRNCVQHVQPACQCENPGAGAGGGGGGGGGGGHGAGLGPGGGGITGGGQQQPRRAAGDVAAIRGVVDPAEPEGVARRCRLARFSASCKAVWCDANSCCSSSFSIHLYSPSSRGMTPASIRHRPSACTSKRVLSDLSFQAECTAPVACRIPYDKTNQHEARHATRDSCSVNVNS